MGLRGRLALFFVAITVVPVTVAVTALQLQIGAQERNRARVELRQVAAAGVASTEDVRREAGELAAELARVEAGRLIQADPAAAQAWLDARELERGADIVVVAGSGGQLRAFTAAGPPPGEATTAEVARRIAAAVAGEPPGALPALLEEAVIVEAGNPDVPLGWIVAGVWLDAALLDDLPGITGDRTGAAFVADGEILASAGSRVPPVDAMPAADEVVSRDVAGEDIIVASTPLRGTDAVLVTWTAAPGGADLAPIAAVLAVSVLAAAPLGWVLAGGVIAPVQRAAEVARAVAAGDLSRSLEPKGAREVVDLAHALNTMSAELAARLGQLQRSRDKLRTSVSRFRETLSSSLDLDRIVALVVDTTVDLLDADGAALLLLAGDGSGLEVRAAQGVGLPDRLDAGEGVLGHVVRTGDLVRFPDDRGDAPPAAAGEPLAPYLVAVALRVRGRPVGVLTVVRTESGPPFVDDDVETIRSLAAQSSVAIENVVLHQETERLSLTNPVTGLWNDRYFRTQLHAELKRAGRFSRPEMRPVSILVIDIDHFKQVNDRFDHAAGDAALSEVGRRLREATRAPDIVTHLHGEEFAVLLPETGYEGALAAGERMRAAVANGPVRLPGAGPGGTPVDVEITCSVGVATFPEHAADQESLYRSADRAMLRAKQRGRNRVVGATERDVPA